jgi:hypothetical protein
VPDTPPSDESALKALNEQYIGAFVTADVRWYQEHLDDDFVRIRPDGSIVDKKEFLRVTAAGRRARETT